MFAYFRLSVTERSFLKAEFALERLGDVAVEKLFFQSLHEALSIYYLNLNKNDTREEDWERLFRYFEEVSINVLLQKLLEKN